MARRSRSERFAQGACASLSSAALALACARPVSAPEPYQRTVHRFQRCSPADPVSPSEAQPLPPALAKAPPELARVFIASRLELPTSRHPTPEEAVGILTRLVVLKSDLATGGAYIDCLDDSLEALHRELLDQSNQHELYLTLGSIGVGAAAATAQGILEVSDPDTSAAPVVGIAGGVGGGAAPLWALASLPAPNLRAPLEPGPGPPTALARDRGAENQTPPGGPARDPAPTLARSQRGDRRSTGRRAALGGWPRAPRWTSNSRPRAR